MQSRGFTRYAAFPRRPSSGAETHLRGRQPMNKPDTLESARTRPRTCPGRRSASTCCARNTPRAPSASSTARRWPAPCARRVARALAAVEADPAAWEPRFLQALEDGFIPGGRINSAAGADIPRRDADQLLRAAGRRFDLRHRRRQARHLPSRCARRRRRCAAAAASATTSAPSAPAAPACAAPTAPPPGRSATCTSSTSPAPRWRAPAPAAARRWACCAATTPTSWSSSAPSGRRASSTTSTSRSASPTR